MAVSINEAGEKRLFTKVNDTPGMMRRHFGQRPDPDDKILAYRYCAVCNRWPIHRRDGACANDHVVL